MAMLLQRSSVVATAENEAVVTIDWSKDTGGNQGATTDARWEYHASGYG
jgi:hypothetical protein